MPTLHSHTHCQAPRANATTKACQRVCLSQRTAGRNDTANFIDRKITKDNKRQCTTSYIKHLAVSGLSSILARIKSTCNLTEKCFEMPNVSYT